MSLRFRVPCPGIRPLGSGPWELLRPLLLSLHPPRTLQEQGTDPRLCHHPLSVSPTSPSSAGSALTLPVPPLTPGSSRSLARNGPAKVCRTGYHPSLGGNTRLSAWLQRPLPGASRGRGGTHRSRGIHHREVVPVEEGGAGGAHERCHDQGAGPVLGKESKARQSRRPGATARGPQDAGEDSQGKDASRPGGAPVWVRSRWVWPVQGAQSAVRPPRPHDCPRCRAARDLCIADLTSFSGAVSSYNPVILAESGQSLTHLRGEKQSQA